MSAGGPQVLIVDDERAIRRFLRVTLTARHYTVYEAVNGEEALAAVAASHPDLIILDLGLPDMDGVEVTRQLREWTQTPLIILSVREDEKEKVAALDAGADDYLTKPFSIEELLARIRASLRHTTLATKDAIFRVGQLSVDDSRRRVMVGEKEIALTPTEYDLLRLLVQNAGKVLTHGYLLREVWGSVYETENHLLRVNMSNLRRKIEPDPSRPRYIITELGVGYRLRLEEEK